jgi:integrase
MTLTWSDATKMWRNEMLAANRSPETIKLRLYYLARWQRVCRRPDTATRAKIVAWLARPSWGPETRRCARTSLVVFYRWMYDEGHLPPGPGGKPAVNPAGRLEKITIPRGVPRPATDDAIQQGLNEAPLLVKLMILLGSLGGLRRAEISRVHTRDLSGRDLLVHGKGGKERIVRLDPQLAASIASAPPGYLFQRGRGAEPQHQISPAHAGVLMSRALPPGTTPHMLRHACGTWLNDNGVPLIDIRDWLGHADISTTQRYVVARIDRAAAATERAARRFAA